MNALTETGSQVQTSDVTTTWVLDPNGNWRAANVQDVETGETKSNRKGLFNYSVTNPDGTKYVIRTKNQWQTDYTYNDHVTIATDINGTSTVSGSGTGSGSVNASFSQQQVIFSGGSSAVSGIRGSLIMGDYAANTINISPGSLVNITFSNADGSTLTTSGTNDGGAVGLFDEYFALLDYTNTDPRWATFDTAGSTSYGIIGNATVTSVVSFTPVRNYGTVVPSDPNADYTEPTWITVTSAAAKGVLVGAVVAGAVVFAAPLAVSGGAYAIGLFGVEAATATAASAAGVTVGLAGLSTVGFGSAIVSSVHDYQNEDWAGLAYTLGQVGGGFIVGYSGGGRLLGENISGEPSQVPPTWWNILADRPLAYNPNYANPSKLGWLASGPTPQSGTLLLMFLASIDNLF